MKATCYFLTLLIYLDFSQIFGFGKLSTNNAAIIQIQNKYTLGMKKPFFDDVNVT